MPEPDARPATRLTIGALRRSVPVLLACAVLGGGLALALDDSQPGYRASAEVIVSTLPEQDVSLLGLSLLRYSRESARAIETAAVLLHSPAAAERAAPALGEDPDELLDDVQVDIVGESNVVAVSAEASSPARAARVANRFAQAAVAVQRERVAKQAAAALEILRARLSGLGPDDPNAPALNARITALEALRASGGDPTLALGQAAAPPRDPAGPSTPLIILLGALAGLAVGLVIALAREWSSPRLSDERALAHVYPLPTLARVPVVRRAFRRRLTADIPPAVREAFRTVVAQLERRGGGHGSRVLLVTSPSAGDGKTTAVACIGEALAEAGYSVAAVDADLRDPALGRVLGVASAAGLGDGRSLDEDGLDDLLEETVRPGLEVVPAVPVDPGALLAAYSELPKLLGALRREFDWVIVDTPALGAVSDALRLLGSVDEILLVCRLGNTSRSHLRAVRGLLEQADAVPMGTLLLGATAPPPSVDEERKPDLAVR
jgi:capsular exopolysaccharide synthesis family protein